jgi:DnaJ-class molecular chaperone
MKRNPVELIDCDQCMGTGNKMKRRGLNFVIGDCPKCRGRGRVFSRKGTR